MPYTLIVAVLLTDKVFVALNLKSDYKMCTFTLSRQQIS